MPKLKHPRLKKLVKKPGRHADGDGLYFRTIGAGRAYWAYRYHSAGKTREMSLGSWPNVSLKEARAKHAKLRAAVLEHLDPLASKRAVKEAGNGTPTFGEMAAAYIQKHAISWRSPKHKQQWTMTLTKYCSAISNVPVDKVDDKAVLRVLEPIWDIIPETASRLRARIEAVLGAAQAGGHIDPKAPNPARWKGWLDHMLADPKKIGERSNHPAMHHLNVPAFTAGLAETPGTPASALAFIILTAARSGEALGATWDEIDFNNSTWNIPARRMKMGKAHSVPLSDAAIGILTGTARSSSLGSRRAGRSARRR